jgi:hypothetical protein
MLKIAPSKIRLHVFLAASTLQIDVHLISLRQPSDLRGMCIHVCLALSKDSQRNAVTEGIIIITLFYMLIMVSKRIFPRLNVPLQFKLLQVSK